MTAPIPHSEREIIKSYEKQFQYYKSLGGNSFTQIDDSALFERQSDEENSVAIIIKHLWGNMLSRWTDFIDGDGEKDWRKRDEEFEIDESSREDIMMKWEDGWNCLFNALSQLDDSMLQNKVLIRNQEHSVLEAINRQLAHYAYHVGQIVFFAKGQAGDSWSSLSIPRNRSAVFNKEKFSRDKSSTHYTDEWIEKKE